MIVVEATNIQSTASVDTRTAVVWMAPKSSVCHSIHVKHNVTSCSIVTGGLSDSMPPLIPVKIGRLVCISHGKNAVTSWDSRESTALRTTVRVNALPIQNRPFWCVRAATRRRGTRKV